MSELMDIILHRRSIRRFETRQIEENALQEILKAGMYAPSAGGRQGVLFVVCQNEEVNKCLGRIKRVNSNPKMATAANYVSREQPSIADDPNLKNAFYDAPTVITMFAPKNFLFAVDDCAVAAENMMLMADSLGNRFLLYWRRVDSFCSPLWAGGFTSMGYSYRLLRSHAAFIRLCTCRR